MIFVTVGTQLPFERLVKAMDAWAASHPGREVVMQPGDTAYRPQHCKFVAHTQPDEWERLFNRAELIVSHAGMGTILKSLDRGKPLIVMPRLAALGEHRNDHQVATVERFRDFGNMRVVNDTAELESALDAPPAGMSDGGRENNANLDRLIREIRKFVETEVRA